MSALAVALVTSRVARPLDEDLAPLEHALRRAGAAVSIADWDDPDVEWRAAHLALLRSPWDYTQRLPEFLAWAERTSAQTRLRNPWPVIRWNTDKHYLAQLAQAAVPIVPSCFIEPGEAGGAGLRRFFALQSDSSEFVVKPAVGAGSRDAQRYEHADAEAAALHVQRLLDARQAVLLQPYLDRVDDEGETALIYFNGIFSHAIRKGPLLRRGEGPTRALFAEEHIIPRMPDANELRVGAQTLTAMPFDTPLYARVDLLRDAAGAPRVLELELTEPSLFFQHAPGAAADFASVILESLR